MGKSRKGDGVGDNISPILQHNEKELRFGADQGMRISTEPVFSRPNGRIIGELGNYFKNSIEEKIKVDSCEQSLWFSFFFDGTGNNMDADTRKGDWGDLILPAEALPAAVGISFSEQQCAQLMRAAEGDGILFQVRATSPRLLEPHTAEHAHALIEYWQDCADHARLESPPDRFDVCIFGLENPGLEARPQLASWLAEPAQAQMPAALFELWLAEQSSVDVSTLSVETKS